MDEVSQADRKPQGFRYGEPVVQDQFPHIECTTYGVSTQITDNNDGTDLPSYIDGDTKLYEIVGSGSYAQTEFVSFTGLLTESTTATVNGDFNLNGALQVTFSSSATLSVLGFETAAGLVFGLRSVVVRTVFFTA